MDPHEPVSPVSQEQHAGLSRRGFLAGGSALAIAAFPLAGAATAAASAASTLSPHRRATLAKLVDALADSPRSIVPGSRRQEAVDRVVAYHAAASEAERAHLDDVLDAIDHGHARGSFAAASHERRIERMHAQRRSMDRQRRPGPTVGQNVVEAIAIVTYQFLHPAFRLDATGITF